MTEALLAYRCSNGHLTVPEHGRCPDCGCPQKGTVELSDRTGTVVTWTENTATPPGVREPNVLVIVEFTVDGQAVRTIGQAEGDLDVGDTVEAVQVEQLRDPEAGIREPASQSWDGYRFRRTK